MSYINGFIIISLLTLIACLIGLFTFINENNEENKCEMTYMFEYPQFVRISNKADKYYVRYGLYAYSEGRFTAKSRDMYFDGVPVLFIPGNAGSFRQVRSLASIALRKAYNSRTQFHFDYFTVDLNSELSGLNGALLNDQLNYVNHSISRVLELYELRRNRPESVILFGHSMGGIIAKAFVSQLGVNSTLIPIVLTLASPHLRPSLMFDSYIYEFYKNFNSIQTNTTFISISGGFSDFLVPSLLTEFNRLNSLSVISTHVPLSWLSADHLCILWCKQTILAINRALFDCVDPKTKHITTDPLKRKTIFHHHLVYHNGIKTQLLSHYNAKQKISLNNRGEWIEFIQRQYSITLSNGTRETKWYMIPLIKQFKHEWLTLVALNLEVVDWVYVCGAHVPKGNGRACEEAYHLTQSSEISPSVRYKRRTIRINMHKLLENKPEMTHLVYRIPPTTEPVIVHVDVYNRNERKLEINLPNWWSFNKRNILLNETPEKIVNFELLLPQLQHILQFYELFLEPVKCLKEFHHSTATILVPWSNTSQEYHKFFTESDKSPLPLRLYTSKPSSSINDNNVIVRLTLDPNCTFRISIRTSVQGILSQIIRYYSPLLLVNISAVILMTLKTQLNDLNNNGKCSIFFIALKEGSKPYYLLTTVKLITRILSLKFLQFLPQSDWLIMAREGSDFLLLPLIMYLTSVGIVWILILFLYGSLIIFETTVHKLVLKFLARTVSFTMTWSDYLLTALHKLPFIVVGILMSLTLTTCGGLALSLGTIFYFLKLTQLSQDYIEEIVWFILGKFTKKFKRQQQEEINIDNKRKKSTGNCLISLHNSIFFHSTLFMIWCLITVLNIPSVLTWAHNFKYSTVLQPDPSFWPGLILSICALPLWQLDMPKIDKLWYSELGHLIAVLAVISLIYSEICVFRLNYTLTIVIVLVTLHQLFGKSRRTLIETTSNPENDDEGRKHYEDVKTKLE